MQCCDVALGPQLLEVIRRSNRTEVFFTSPDTHNLDRGRCITKLELSEWESWFYIGINDNTFNFDGFEAFCWLPHFAPRFWLVLLLG